MGGPEKSGQEQPEPRGLQAVFDRPAPTRKQLLLNGGHLAALWTLVFVQPLLDLLGNNPDFFVARGNTPADILILAIGITLVPPLALLALEWLASLIGPRTYYGLHFLLLTLIALFLAIRILGDRVPGRTLGLLLVALLLGMALAWSIFRFRFVRNLMDILIVAPLVVLLLFVFASRASEVILPGGDSFRLAADSGDDTPIVLIVFDELATGNLMTDQRSIDGERFPNFARLARTSTWYRNQTTTAFFTPLAVPGILTGIREDPGTLPTAQQQPLSIFSQFGHNRKVHVMEPVTAICPSSLCPAEGSGQSTATRLRSLISDLKYVEGWLVLPPRIARRLPDVNSNFAGFGQSDSGSDSTKPAAGSERMSFLVKGLPHRDAPMFHRFINTIPDSNRGLTVMHIELPHKAWEYDTRGQLYNRTSIDSLSAGTNRWLVDSNGISTAQARMYTQTGYADHILGATVKRLTRLGLWDRAMVVVAADHGISFKGGPVPQRRIDRRAMGEVANPPLFIKYPGQKQGEVSLKPSQTVDIMPTIAKALHVRRPYRMDGVPLQGPVPDRKVEVYDFQGNEATAPLSTVVRQRRAAINTANERLGTGPIYTLGAAPELIGRRVPPVPPTATDARLDTPDLWNRSWTRNPRLPLFVTGTVTGSDSASGRPGALIAIALNGRIRGTGRTFAFQGEVHFGALIDPSSLRPGHNTVGIYEVGPNGTAPLGGN